MSGFKVSHVGLFVFHAMTVPVLLSRGPLHEGSPFGSLFGRHHLLFRPED